MTGPDLGRLIVHGHVPQESGCPAITARHVNLDTGAVFGVPLTAAVFNPRCRGPIAILTDIGSVEELSAD
jgi:serine/threonine protein phosphatase 1